MGIAAIGVAQILHKQENKMTPQCPYRAEVYGIPSALNHYPFKNGDIICVLGELSHMEGHFVIALPDGKVVFGYHNDFFIPLDAK